MICRSDRREHRNGLSESLSKVGYAHFVLESQRSTDIQMAGEIRVAVIEGAD